MSLCCQVNPKTKCRFCSAKLCADHCEYKKIDGHTWCQDCADSKEDFVDLIETYFEKYDAAYGYIEEINDSVSGLETHLRKCLRCSSGNGCPDLADIANEILLEVDKSYRRARKV